MPLTGNRTLSSLGYAALALLVVVGCAQPDGPVWNLNPHPVKGRVLYDGKPAEGVLVGLIPIDAPMPPAIPANPTAITGPDGAFTIGTIQPGDGACVGRYQIVLNWMVSKEDESDEENKIDKLLGWYDAAHSPLNLTVIEGENSVPEIKIPPRTILPEQMPGIPGRN